MRCVHATVAAAGISLILLGTVAAQDPAKPPETKAPTAPVPRSPPNGSASGTATRTAN